MMVPVLVLLLPALVAASNCPSDCFCKFHQVYCTKARLKALPVLGSEHTELYVKGASLGRLTSVATMPQLALLHLIDCGITGLEPGVLSSLTSLSTLDLRGNLVQVLEAHTFSGLGRLTRLTLDSNVKLRTIKGYALHGLNLTSLSMENVPGLELLEEQAFLGSQITELRISNASLGFTSETALADLRRSLRELSWTRNRFPLTLSGKTLFGFTLTSLTLEDNGLSETGFLRFVTVSESLSLSGNNLAEIDLRKMPGLHSLRKLLLDSIGLRVFEAYRFSDLRQLQQLSLANNSLRLLAPDSFNNLTALQRIVLRSNPLHCNCKLKWLQAFVRVSSIRIVQAECATPVRVSLREAQRFECTAPEIVYVSHPVRTASSTDVVLTCRATGDPAPVVTWQAPDGDVLSVTTAKGLADGTTEASETLIDVNSADSGLYQCVASNTMGRDERTTDLTVYQAIVSYAESKSASAAPRVAYVTSGVVTLSTTLYWLV